MKNASRKIIQSQLNEIAEESHIENLRMQKEQDQFLKDYLEIRESEDARRHTDMVGFVE
jgi:hypothetical protein